MTADVPHGSHEGQAGGAFHLLTARKGTAIRASCLRWQHPAGLRIPSSPSQMKGRQGAHSLV